MALPQSTHRLTEVEFLTLEREAFGLNATLSLPSLKIAISLAEVFRNVKFEPETGQREPPRRG